MIAHVYRCDVCKTEKKDANHWFVIKVAHNLTLDRWNESLAVVDGVLHICGQACAVAKVNEFLGGNRGTS